MNDLRTVRKNSCLTQQDVAGMMGIRQCTIAELESGMRLPRSRTKKKLEGLLGEIDWKQTLAGSERHHLMFALNEFINESGPGDPKEKIRFAKQALTLLENSL